MWVVLYLRAASTTRPKPTARKSATKSASVASVASVTSVKGNDSGKTGKVSTRNAATGVLSMFYKVFAPQALHVQCRCPHAAP